MNDVLTTQRFALHVLNLAVGFLERFCEEVFSGVSDFMMIANDGSASVISFFDFFKFDVAPAMNHSNCCYLLHLIPLDFSPCLSHNHDFTTTTNIPSPRYPATKINLFNKKQPIHMTTL